MTVGNMHSPYLFVYGTLKSDAINANANHFHQYAKLIGEAKWQGRLYLVSNYPGAVRSAKNEFVIGELWELSNPEYVLGFLDEYEECAPGSLLPYEYQRSIELVEIGGEMIAAWVYIYRLDTSKLKHIESGDFINDNQELVRRALASANIRFAS
jgi:gamma-glutamylcyclotransferase (GGCT)/AIG2-like uncharacterized protein YtfP